MNAIYHFDQFYGSTAIFHFVSANSDVLLQHPRSIDTLRCAAHRVSLMYKRSPGGKYAHSFFTAQIESSRPGPHEPRPMKYVQLRFLCTYRAQTHRKCITKKTSIFSAEIAFYRSAGLLSKKKRTS